LALTPGTRLGVYEVTEQIGEGGMGQVHRARDKKLNRDVALKVLPESFANDSDRLARFTREAQTLASLHHPNIAHIHGRLHVERVRTKRDPHPAIHPTRGPGSGDGVTGAAGAQWQVSTAGGIHPRWHPAGSELYFLNPAGEMMAASITTRGEILDVGAPVVLFATRVDGGGVKRGQGPQYDVARDGRFLINTELDSAAAPITLLMNWKADATK
jgi:hypothetical protein